MPARMMILNPKRRSPGPRRMSALQRMYFGKRRSSRRRARPRTIYRSRNPVVAAPASYSPAKRRRRARSFYNRRIIRARHNISSTVGGFVTRDLLPAAVGAAGALAVDMIWPHLNFLPAQVMSGPLAPVVRIGAALGVGYVAGMVGGKAFGRQAMMGGLLVTVYDIAKGYMAQALPPPAPAPAPAVSGYAPMGWPSPARDGGGTRYLTHANLHGYAPLNGYAPQPMYA